MIRIELQKPLISFRAKQIIENGFGSVSNWELLKYLVKVAKRDNLEIEFVRLENGGEVVLDLDHMEAALEMGWEMRPLDSWVDEVTNCR